MESASWKTAIRLGVSAILFCIVSGCGYSGFDSSDPAEEGDSVPVPELTPEERAELDQFYEPVLTSAEENALMQHYAYIDLKAQVPTVLLKRALAYFEANKSRIPNKSVLTVVDFSPLSSNARMFIVNMNSGAVTALHIAHGSGSDPDDDGDATLFSNVSGSKKSSLGYYRTAETYYGKHGYSLRLDGLSSTNSNVRKRAIVVHSAAYVKDANVKQGRSAGCLAVSDANRKMVVDALKSGSIIYAALSR